MLEALKARYRKEQFMPTWLSIIVNSNYLIRRGIYKGIRENAGFMKGRMLDIGCGQKPYRNLFNVEKYIGIDIHNEGHNNNTSMVDVFYDGMNIPFESEYFDSAYSSEVITHISNIEPVIEEISRVIKKGGNFLITAPFVWHENEQPNDAVRYTSFGLISLLERHHFKIIEQKKCGNYFTTALQTRNAFLYNALFPKSNFVKLLLTVIFIFPANLFGYVFSPLLGSNDDLFSNMVIVAEKM